MLVENEPALREALEVAAWATEARIAVVDDELHLQGNPTDGALLALACKGGVAPVTLNGHNAGRQSRPANLRFTDANRSLRR